MSGINGHLNHPYEIAKTGQDLIQLFTDAVRDIKKQRSVLKIDGISLAVRLVNGKFVIDRGSNKKLDVEGVRQENLDERFGTGHGLVRIGQVVLDLFDKVQGTIEPELAALGITNDSNVVLNFEFVDKKTNIINYSKQLFVIHGLKAFSTTADKRVFTDKESQPVRIQKLIEKFNSKSDKFKMIGQSVIQEFKQEPSLDIILDEQLSLNGETKTLAEWLEPIKITLPLITREEFKTLDKMSDKVNLSTKELNDYILYYTTIRMGDEIITSLGLDGHEGIIVSGANKFKITGSFIVKNLTSPFAKVAESYTIQFRPKRKLTEEHSLGYLLWGWITPAGKILYGDDKSLTHRQSMIRAYTEGKISEKDFTTILQLYGYKEKLGNQDEKVNFAKKNTDASVLNATKVGFIRFLIDPDPPPFLTFETSLRPTQKILYAIGKVTEKAKKEFPVKKFELTYRGNKTPYEMNYLEFITTYDLGIKVPKLKESTEQKTQSVIAIPGGFHPFHPGHLSLYNSAKKLYPNDRIVFLASNKTETRPFAFDEKIYLASLLGIDAETFIQMSNPLDQEEAQEKLGTDDITYIRGTKEFKVKNFKAIHRPIRPFPVLDKMITSATQIRKMYQDSSEQERKQIISDLYGKSDPKVKKIFDGNLLDK